MASHEATVDLLLPPALAERVESQRGGADKEHRVVDDVDSVPQLASALNTAHGLLIVRMWMSSITSSPPVAMCG